MQTPGDFYMLSCCQPRTLLYFSGKNSFVIFFIILPSKAGNYNYKLGFSAEPISPTILKKTLVILGTRPEAIKMAPVIRELRLHSRHFITKVCVTAQHREMLDQVLEFFDIVPEYDLNLMTHNQNLYDLTAGIISNLRPVLEEFAPDYVLVHGDTTTTMAASIAAYYNNSRLFHVEAGMRTFDKRAPFPEEVNRRITGHIADVHFAPTEANRSNLVRENIPDKAIVVTGNTVIDALLESVELVRSREFPSIEALKQEIDPAKDILLLTMHRRENHGEGVEKISDAILQVAAQANVQVVYPVHRNPNIFDPVYRLLGDRPNIKLVPPQPYEAFVWLMDKAKLIITDSGGVQEEAPSLGKPVLVLRNVTERPEAVSAGTAILVGSDTDRIVTEAMALLTDATAYEAISRLHNPYGDGTAARKIIDYMIKSA